MNTLEQQLAGESLRESLGQLENRIRKQPGDADLRAAFTQMLCLEGNWPRALAQLKSWLALTPQAQPTITLLEQTINGERQRVEVMAGRARPTMPDKHWPWLAAMVAALDLSATEACSHRIGALEQAEAIPGELTLQDGTTHSFDWLMDGDCRFGPVCEAIVNGRYFWLPFSAIEEMEFQPRRASSTWSGDTHASACMTAASKFVRSRRAIRWTIRWKTVSCCRARPSGNRCQARSPITWDAAKRYGLTIRRNIRCSI
jgi:type VI secretion system protein ImpE